MFGQVNPYFARLGQVWVEAARRRGASIDAPELDSALSSELLDLARVVAHGQERRYAPLAAYLAGIAAERLRQAGAGADLAGFVREVREQLEAEEAATEVRDPGGC
jgi:hypothetical protein